MSSDSPDRERTEQLTTVLAGLSEELRSVEADLVSFRSDRANAADDDEHDPDGMPLSAVWQRLESRKERLLAQIRETGSAMRSMSDGTYGVCEICSLPIPPARLEIRPTTRRCVTCADLRM